MELIVFLIFIGFTIFWIWTVVDCATNEENGNEKIVWILIILFGSCFGSMVYYVVRRPRRLAELGK